MSASLDPFDVRRIVCTPTAKQRGVKVDQISTCLTTACRSERASPRAI